MRLLIPTVAVAAITSGALAGGATDQLAPAASGTVRIEGWLGQRMAFNLAHHVLAQNVGLLIHPFRNRTEQNSRHWQCEHWGKWFTSPAPGCAYEPTR